jgi:hypothetical protein
LLEDGDDPLRRLLVDLFFFEVWTLRLGVLLAFVFFLLSRIPCNKKLRQLKDEAPAN